MSSLSQPSAIDAQPCQDWNLVVAIARNGVIGRGSELPWRQSSDLKRFKTLTMGQCLLMGRKTFDSIGKPLPGRQTIVLTRHPIDYPWPEVLACHSLAAVPEIVEAGRQVMVVGGAEVYRQTIERCQRMWITRVLADVEGDVFFPAIDWSCWRRVSMEPIPAGERDQWPTEFEQWQRR